MKRYTDFKTTTDIVKEACRIAVEKDTSENAVVFLEKAQADNRPFWNNYLVSDFISAALDIISVAKYKGDREEILRLMDSGLEFV